MHTLALAALQSPTVRRWIITVALAAVGVPALFFGCGVIIITGANADTPKTTGPGGGCGPISAAGGGPMTDEQISNAAAIIAVGRQLGVPAHGWVVAIATALAESGLRNLDHGDRDSLGLFQQRPSQGWGTPQQILDPTYAATAFYTGAGTNPGLLNTAGWETMAVTVAAQTVQRSALPDAYARHEPQARTTVTALADDIPATAPCTPGTIIGGLALPLPTQWVTVPAPEHHDYPAIDYAAPTGTPVYAVTGGTIAHVDGGYGLGIRITTPDGTTWIYGHNSVQLAQPGATVNAGDQIAISGNTGRSTGPHLHLEIRTPDGAQRCPQTLIDALSLGLPVPEINALPTAGCSY